LQEPPDVHGPRLDHRHARPLRPPAPGNRSEGRRPARPALTTPNSRAPRRWRDAWVMHGQPSPKMGKPCKTGLSFSRSVSGILSGAAIHLGRPSPAGSLPPTWSSAGRVIAPIGVAPGGACLAAPVSGDAGGLLHHRFTLASAFTCDAGGRSPLCCAIQRVSPSG